MSRAKKKASISVRKVSSLSSMSLPQVSDEVEAAEVIGETRTTAPKPAEGSPSTRKKVAQPSRLKSAPNASREPAAPQQASEEKKSAAATPASVSASASLKKKRSGKSRPVKLPPPEVLRGPRKRPSQDPSQSWSARHKKVMWECPIELLELLNEYKAQGYSKNSIITAAVRAYLGKD